VSARLARVVRTGHLDVWFLFAMTVALLVLFRLLEPDWLNGRILQSLVAQNAPLALVALAMTFAVISRYIDLSPGSMIGLAGAVVGVVYSSTGSLGLAVVAGLATGIGGGLLNGLVVAGLGVNAIMATLAAYIWARGLALAITHSDPIEVGGSLGRIVNHSVGGFTITAPLVLAAYVGGAFLLARTRMGRYTYAMGGDPVAARRAGVNVTLYSTLIFVLMGVMVGLSSLIVIGQLTSAQPYAGAGLELDAIIAVIIGGSRLSGGEGNVARTAMGVVFLAILNSGLNNLGLTDAYYQLYKGAALLGVLAVQVWLRRLVAEDDRRRHERAQVAAAEAA
jgi:ribose transport system permease protein